MMHNTKTLILGSAQWGWTVTKQDAFALLDTWLSAGHKHLDCATNYPINRNPADFRAAEQILQEYIQAHGLKDLQLTMKIGSLDNMRTPDVNLSPSFIQMMTEEYLRLFGSNLQVIMLHWDNRDDVEAIGASLEALKRLQELNGIQPGLSGIAYPDAYAQANESLQLSFDIQLKHNLLQSDMDRYRSLQAPASPGHRYFAYGINAGGLKLEPPYPADSTFLARGGQPEKVAPLLERINALLPDWNTAFVRPPVKTMNQIGMIFAGLHPGLSGILLGVSSASQLKTSLEIWRDLDTFDYNDVYSTLKKILLP